MKPAWKGNPVIKKVFHSYIYAKLLYASDGPGWDAGQRLQPLVDIQIREIRLTETHALNNWANPIGSHLS